MSCHSLLLAGSLKGVKTEGTHGTGQLPQDWANTFQARSHVIDFVVYSYATPIAWHDIEAGWVMPDERYSPTTSKQQGKIRYAALSNHPAWQMTEALWIADDRRLEPDGEDRHQVRLAHVHHPQG